MNTNILIPGKTTPSDPWIFCAGDENTYTIVGIPNSRYGGNFVSSAYVVATHIPPPASLAGPFQDTVYATLDNLELLSAIRIRSSWSATFQFILLILFWELQHSIIGIL